MQPKDQYLEINQALWDQRTGHHVDSEFYDMDSFRAGRNSLNDIELPLLGDVAGKDILHLQCHFGQDTMSLARMGANATGIDFSGKAIEAARAIAEELGIAATFVQSDVYALPQVLNKKFDIVFTSYGTIGWLPDINKWAAVVKHFLKPGGKFVFAEFHPAVWMFDNGFDYVQYSYFNKEEIIEEEQGTYGDRNAPIRASSISWNHPLSDVLQSLLDAGLKLEVFREFDYSPYNCFSGMQEISPGKFIIEKLGGRIPMVYALQMQAE